jgi:catechol 2,3-dioxygenase-like lactoylglutathione lyase family enzyme
MKLDFRLSTISIIMLGVSDLDRAVTFYRDKLGLPLSTASGEFAFFQAGGVTLALSTVLSKARHAETGAVEVVFSDDHVALAYRKLCERGILFTHAPHLVTGASWAANFNDPDGHALSVFGPE